ncbi:hypothetical protein [Anabaena azotica]|uniref:Uncharacterized protein n=1 Tax=Anabaena azotica FACHB-119 TaxID=947527 RepID=A0ABR8DBY3_9NOST|nr:hypothetical protein [Anabaena azotica]MBD2504086.1 hypothetical protein [Anabaena azotica FACHB-119]
MRGLDEQALGAEALLMLSLVGEKSGNGYVATLREMQPERGIQLSISRNCDRSL